MASVLVFHPENSVLWRWVSVVDGSWDGQGSHWYDRGQRVTLSRAATLHAEVPVMRGGAPKEVRSAERTASAICSFF